MIRDMNYDLILSGGIIVDGSGNPWFKADVGIKDGKIAKIGKIPCSKADKHIDVAGLVLAPGFIDIHSHSDMILWTKPELDCKIRQGITTEVVGNCGSSAAPLYGEAYEEAEKFIENLPGGSEKKPFWSTISEYLQALKEQGVPVNVATLIGHSTVRTCVMGFRDDDPSRSEMNEMKELVDQGMKDGAFGLSTGLIYAPGCYAKTSELIALSKVVADHGGIYVSHVRNEGNKLLQSIWEAIEIGRKAGLPIHISHHKASGVMNWGKVRISLSLMEEVRREGIDVTCDVYPYTAGCSWCLSHILPRWISEGGVTEMIRRLKKRGVRERIRRQIEQGVDVSPLLELGEWDSIIIAAVKSEKNRNVEGMSLAEISRLKGMDPLDCIFDLIIDEEDEITGFFFT
ncbi:TPA: D-aminoacylase, partial [Candidatus Bathyarchaeota archaeon]|nr:D-aminoacylase [Candidatus Bathyarchaeota archaeon]